METAPFSDPDGDAHLCTDWEIQVASTNEVAWASYCSPILVHIHFGDGTFMNSYAGKTQLAYNTDYRLRVRDSDDSGDPATRWSTWAVRLFHTSVAPITGGPVAWTLRQSGFVVDEVAGGFTLPVNIAFIPNAGTSPTSPYYYVTELYGNIKVVTRNGTVSDYARGLLNYTPSGKFPGSGEEGLAGLLVDPASGDVFASMLYQIPGGTLYAKVLRFHSNHAGTVAGSSTLILDIHEAMSASHQISNLSIGTDGKLYVHVGDGMVTSTAQDLASFRGKILRLNLDGTAPSDNPFYNSSDGITARDYVFAYGFRNPFGGDWRPADGKHYEVENGPSVDRFAQVVRGRNYLWSGSDASMRNYAIFNWEPAVAPVNLAFVAPTIFGGSGFPSAKKGHAFVSESGATYATGPQTDGKKIEEFALDANGSLLSGPTTLIEYTGTGKGTAVGLAAGPDGLYFSDLYEDTGTSPLDPGANIYRIRAVTSDATAPTTTAPDNRFYASTVNQTSPQIPLVFTWTAGDPESGIAKTELQESINAGTYANVTLGSQPAVRLVTRLPYSSTTTYRFRDRATNGVGGVSAWATGPTFRVRAFQETTASPTLVFTTGWSSSSTTSYFGGALKYASAAGQKATFTFSGTDFALVSTKGTNRGKFQLYLDGVAGSVVDLYSTAAYRQVVGIVHFSVAGTHKVEIRVLGQKNAASTGYRVDFDAALTMGT
jgi:glucose/arabinose dehydrogenase